MNISQLIAEFIDELLAESQGVAELKRGNLARRFNCVPSQINYVLETRFTPERGFSVESRRGGGGYIRISRVKADRQSLMMQVINAIGEDIDPASAAAFLSNLAYAGLLEEREAKIINALVSDKALKRIPAEVRDLVRADILKQGLIGIRADSD